MKLQISGSDSINQSNKQAYYIGYIQILMAKSVYCLLQTVAYSILWDVKFLMRLVMKIY